MPELEKILEEIDKATDEYGMVDYINNEPVISKKQAKDIIRRHMNDGWIPVEKFGLPKSNEHDFRFWVTIQYVNGFRRTLKATWNYYNNHFVYQNGRVISEDVVAYKYYSAPEPYHSEGSNEHDGE